MLKSEAAAYLAGVTSDDEAQASAPTNLHLLTGEVVSASEDGNVRVAVDGMMFSEEDDQSVEIETLGGLEEGDTVTILLAGENGRAMSPLAIGAPGSVDRIVTHILETDELVADKATITDLEAAEARIGDLEADTAEIETLVASKADITDLTAATGRITNLESGKADITDLTAATGRITNLETNKADITDLTAATGRITNLEAGKADIADLTAATGRITNLESGKADIDAANINTATIQNAWVNKLLVQTNLISNVGNIFTLDAIQVNASSIKAGTIDVERLLVTGQDGHKYLIHVDGQGAASYEKLDGDVIEDLTITADKLVAHSITASQITTQNIVGTSGWINVADGTFSYGTTATGGNGIFWDGTNLVINGSVQIGQNQVTLPSISQTANTAATNASAALTDAANAAKTATDYISIDPTDGIRIADANPSTSTTYQRQTSTKTEFVVGGATMSDVSGDGLKVYDGSGTAAANILAEFTTSGAQIGSSTSAHVETTSTSTNFYGANGSTNIMQIGQLSGDPAITFGSGSYRYIVDSSTSNLANFLMGCYSGSNNRESDFDFIADGKSGTATLSLHSYEVSGKTVDICPKSVTLGANVDLELANGDLTLYNGGSISCGSVDCGGSVIAAGTCTIDAHSLILTSGDVNRNTTLSEDTGGTGIFCRELTGSGNIGYIRSYGRSGADRKRGLQIGGHNLDNSAWNMLYLLTDKDGNRIVQVSEVAPWAKTLRFAYTPGDTFSDTIHTAGYVTSSGKDIYYTIPLVKGIEGTLTLTSMTLIARQGGNYIVGSASSGTNVKSLATVSRTAHGLGIKVSLSSAPSGVTNNDTVGIACAYAFSVS